MKKLKYFFSEVFFVKCRTDLGETRNDILNGCVLNSDVEEKKFKAGIPYLTAMIAKSYFYKLSKSRIYILGQKRKI